MNKLLGEYTPSKAFIFLFPYRNDIWRRQAVPAQKMIVDLCNIVVKSEPVILGVVPECKEYLLNNFDLDKNVKVIEMKYNDSWPRDSISNVVFVDGEPTIISYDFNAYGERLYYPWDDDCTLDEQVSKYFDYKLQKCHLTTEGGNMVTDGVGTLFAVKESLIDKNRNPKYTLEEVEELLKKSTGCSQIIWFERGLMYDETGGHVDNLIAFVDEKTVLLSWTDDKDNEHYEIVREVEEVLKNARNLNGEPYKIIYLPVPRITYRDAEDCAEINPKDSSFARNIGDPILNTYVNALVSNKIVVIAKYGIKEDDEALKIFQDMFKDRTIVQLDGKEASLGGGGFHCLSKNIN